MEPYVLVHFVFEKIFVCFHKCRLWCGLVDRCGYVILDHTK